MEKWIGLDPGISKPIAAPLFCKRYSFISVRANGLIVPRTVGAGLIQRRVTTTHCGVFQFIPTLDFESSVALQL